MKILENIPSVFATFTNWVVWREEPLPDGRKSKVPYQATESDLRAKSTDPQTWNKLSSAVKKALLFSSTAYKSGTGFVITADTGLICIDLDDPAKLGMNAASAQKLHDALIDEFSDTYTEISPNGKGYHIWLYGQLPEGRASLSLKAAAGIEIYADQRFMTMTGDVVGYCHEVTNQQEKLNRLIEYMVKINGGKMPGVAFGGSEAEILYDLGRRNDLSDADVLATAMRNNSVFMRFYNAEGVTDRSAYAKPVAGDLDKITGLPDQILRIMLESPIGKMYSPSELERKLFTYWLPEARESNKDILEKREAGRQMQQAMADAELMRQSQVEAAIEVRNLGVPQILNGPFKNGPATITEYATDYPPGMVGVIAKEIRERATMRASKDFAIASALSLFAGLSGHAYSFERVNGALYMLMLGTSGQGKEAPAEARDTLSQQLKAMGVHPDLLSGLQGPSKITSPQGLHRRLEKDKTLLCIMGESTVWLNDLAASKQNIGVEIKRFVLDLYGKMGKNRTLSPSEVLNKDNKLNAINGPAATLLMEGEPSVYFELVGNDTYTASGLCARIIHVEGSPNDMPEKNYGHTSFSDYVIQNLAAVLPMWAQKRQEQITVAAASERNMGALGGITPEVAWIAVRMTDDCLAHHRAFDREMDFFLRDNVGRIADIYNRVMPNVLRVAVNLAAGIDPHNPVIDLSVYLWAQEFVLRGLMKVSHRVDNGETGTGDLRVRAIIVQVIEAWLKLTFKDRAAHLRDTGGIKSRDRRNKLAKFPGMPWHMLLKRIGPRVSRHVDGGRSVMIVKSMVEDMNQSGEITLYHGVTIDGETFDGRMVGMGRINGIDDVDEN